MDSYDVPSSEIHMLILLNLRMNAGYSKGVQSQRRTHTHNSIDYNPYLSPK